MPKYILDKTDVAGVASVSSTQAARGAILDFAGLAVVDLAASHAEIGTLKQWQREALPFLQHFAGWDLSERPLLVADALRLCKEAEIG